MYVLFTFESIRVRYHNLARSAVWNLLVAASLAPSSSGIGQHKAISVDEVLTIVPEEGILLAMFALLSPGDRVVVTMPAYQSLFELASSRGCIIVPWSLTPPSLSPTSDSRRDAWQLDMEFLKRTLGDPQAPVKMVVV